MVKVFTLVLQLLTGIPSLITAAEAMWQHLPKSGPQKWISVEQGASGLIQSIVQEVLACTPNAKADSIATAVSKFTKAANDALVAFYNDVGWPTAATAPAPAPAAPAPAPVTK